MRYFKKICCILILYCVLVSLSIADTTLIFKFQGIEKDILKNTESRLEILKDSYTSLNKEAVRTIYQQSINEIRRAIQPYGYFKPHIESHLSHTKSEWVAYFAINLGKPIQITNLDIKLLGPGKKNPELLKLIKNFPLQKDSTFTSDRFNKAKDSLYEVANNQGYIKAFLKQNKIIIDLDHYQVKITMHFETGSRYYFGQAEFDGNAYSPNFLKRFIPFNENEPFSSEKLIQLQQALSTSYYFQQILVTPDFNAIKQYHVPIKISLLAPKAKKYNIGIGYGTVTGARFTSSLSLRRLTDTGHHFDAQLKLSSVLSGVAGKYYIPGKNPLTDQMIIGLNYQRFLPKNGSSSSMTMSLGYVKKKEKIQATADINYLIEHYKVEGMQSQHSQFFYPNVTFSYTNSDDLIHPLFGQYFYSVLRGASKAFFSTTDFLQTDMKAKIFLTPTDFAHVILRGEFGYTVVNNLKQLPLSMRFFAGGLSTIRGYHDSSIGPGKYLYVGSIEYQNHIKNNWSGAVFYDFGTATNHFGSKISKGAGVGLIYESPIGPARLYVAQALNFRKRPYSIEFSIGPEF